MLVDASRLLVLSVPVLGFFAVGVTLAEEAEEGALKFPPPLTPAIGAAIVLRGVVAPGLLLVLAAPFIDLPAAFLLDGAMPAGLHIVVLAHVYGLDVPFAAGRRSCGRRWSRCRSCSSRPSSCERMRALVQRVSRASVDVDGERVAEIGPGLLVLLGITHDDTAADADRLADKVRALRIFPDADGRMNEPLGDEREVLCVSQFTLYGDARKGNRPGLRRRRPAGARRAAVRALLRAARAPSAGVFGAHMDVELVNDGPVTLLLEVP